MYLQKELLIGVMGLMLAMNISGCRKKDELKCVPSEEVEKVTVEKTPLPTGDINRIRKDLDQCHACVLSMRGFYSCQTVWQTGKETREELKAEARKKACKDAGYSPDKCPEAAVKLVQCKGDAAPTDSKLAESFRRMMVKAASQKHASSSQVSAGSGQEASAPSDNTDAPVPVDAPTADSAADKKYVPQVE